MLKWGQALVLAAAVSVVGNALAEDQTSFQCNDADIFSRLFNQICWSCFLPVQFMGIGGDRPAGAASSQPFCACRDALGVPEYGFQAGYWAPVRLIETPSIPWCSPSLGGIKLQDDLFSLGLPMDTKDSDQDTAATLARMQYHYFAMPLFAMLEILYLSECSDGYTDFDLMYLSEVDPLWNNDLTAILLNPEAIIFSSPLTRLWCIGDCLMVSTGNGTEETYGCAGCDGHLYPMTGNVNESDDPVRVSSLIAQRAIAGLHRRGVAHKTIGDDAMCEAEFWPTLPRSQYKFSMLYPVPEAAVSPGRDCCHSPGESVHLWSTAAGGRSRPGMEDYVHMVWRYRDCCVRNVPLD
ncbi:TraU family protein [Ferrimonas kyonanensis]|uniref:TraU family protein n=1 Tax=Ferrimonas kyonanensis TaxID=364763 RepID=UPI00047F543B|nr:TraU family protein [Ferrimonas kyonanensis]